MAHKRYDSDADISRKLNILVANSEKLAKKATAQAAKVYANNLRANTPVYEEQTHDTHAIEVIKTSGFLQDRTAPTKEVGFSVKGDNGWYIHFPDVGTKVHGTVRQRPQHFAERSFQMSKAPILAIYKNAVRDMFNG
ncbi:HK97-gp10 family putative phage morphogenesis protein [Staphylococcus caprae]|uniref:HK97-gp10 family putative phage morphogenesis protein n=1 Tax=Staphylococcus caprae TaxID=29380 RepID=UPI001C83BA30|nr:HK97-gp10 family putative phage morphogenesis protein [Staphylococcus caprae]MBX5315957.1 hypothetical protein [Staphylococcus caprae]